tara:strand:+ start:199 stop:606 length:408 start_codon:yes stop_codon:yes gene_type:complete
MASRTRKKKGVFGTPEEGRKLPTQPKTVGGRINRMLNPTSEQRRMQTVTDATRASDIKALKNFAKGAGALGLAYTAFDFVKSKFEQYQKEKDAERKREIMREVRGKVMSETKLNKGGVIKANAGASVKPNRMARK